MLFSTPKRIYGYCKGLAGRPAATRHYRGDLGRREKGQKYSQYRNL